jgi:Zn-dependent peptidase ImmA (M78 family)/DNA-binding XRE family transcriptional regulator
MESPFANRLIAARKMAGLSLADLANQLEGVITRQALHKYEQNITFPNSKILIALSKILKVPVDFFFSAPEIHVELEQIDFRKLKRVSKTDEEAIKLQFSDALDRFLTLENIMNEEKNADSFAGENTIRTHEDAENAAEKLRSDWNLGYDPIPNVTIMLEAHGYKVIEIETDADFDGLKAVGGNARLIGVKKSLDICRKRFTLLHELAHHVLHFPDEMEEKAYEKLCHTFAGAVLFPKNQVLAAMKTERFHFYERELVLLKNYWGISISAMFARAKNLEIISEHVFRKFLIGYKTRQYHLPGKEPGEFRGDEKPLRFDSLLMRGLAEEILSFNQAASLQNVTVGELRATLNQIT